MLYTCRFIGDTEMMLLDVLLSFGATKTADIL